MDDGELLALRQDAEALTAALADARQAVEQGTPLEMDGLDAWVGALCAGATALPPRLAKQLLPQLDAVVSGMDALSAALARQQDLLMNAAAAKPDPATARQRAVSAYGGPPPAPQLVEPPRRTEKL